MLGAHALVRSNSLDFRVRCWGLGFRCFVSQVLGWTGHGDYSYLSLSPYMYIYIYIDIVYMYIRVCGAMITAALILISGLADVFCMVRTPRGVERNQTENKKLP